FFQAEDGIRDLIVTGVQTCALPISCTTCVFADNTIVGNGVRDALSQDSQNNPLTNVDIARNTVSGYVDDGIEFKGSNLNVRAWRSEERRVGKEGRYRWSPDDEKRKE